ncbi:hypothetical protein BB558_000252 [Smittium angustum]|uniref:PH domain-containing protein n=1 Tax=Smittium angustum TaxID=133377 RepID=A0A2U1JEQ3_SMIAN|nr:hypothetical protein BB558_000252 [Smittium angustum]
MNKFRSLVGSNKSSSPSSTTSRSSQDLDASKTLPDQMNTLSVSPAPKQGSPLKQNNPFDDKDQDKYGTPLSHQSSVYSNPDSDNTTPSSFQVSQSSTTNSKGHVLTATAGTGTESDLFVMRLQAWKHIIKNFSAYCTALGENASNQAKAYNKLESTLIVNQTDSQYFLSAFDNGIINLVGSITKSNRTMASRCSDLVVFMNNDIIPKLQALRKEIKTEVKTYTSRMTPIISRINKYQKEVDEEVQKLSKAVDLIYKQQSKTDPWIHDMAIRKALKKRCIADDTFYAEVQEQRKHLGSFDSSLAERFSKIVSLFIENLINNRLPNDIFTQELVTTLQTFPTNTEWESFEEKYASALNSPMGRLEHNVPEDYEYPFKGSSSTNIIKEGNIEREKGLIKSFTSAYIVITESGFLHSFSKKEDVVDADSDISLYISKATIEEGQKSTFTIKIPSGYPGKGTHNFRCKDAVALQEWLSVIRSKVETIVVPEK